jgi:Peptidase A4 family
MKRLLSLASVGLMCAGTIAGTLGVAGAATLPGRDVAFQPGGPIIKVPGNSSLPTVSLNWSGYAAVSKTPFNYVHSTFVQPSVRCPGIANQLTSNWVGLDGFTNQTVEQDGTFGFCGGPNHTTPRYEAWIEMYPMPSVNVFAVHAGDIINEQVSYAGGEFTLSVSDLTTGKSSTTRAACSSCKRASAEWIIERPAICLNRTCTKAALTELADYGTSTMSADQASVDGGPVMNVGKFLNYPIFMICPIHSGFISLDTVGPLQGPSFTATWDRHGTITPITLGPRI